jgi:YD repeat-containing protein
MLPNRRKLKRPSHRRTVVAGYQQRMFSFERFYMALPPPKACLGDWIDYNTQGQAVSYGDRNDNTVWLARDTAGIVHGVVDANGRTLMSLIYSGDLLIEIKDHAIAGQASDLAARSIKYTYDNLNRLTKVTDARGNDTQYAYDARNRLVKITDPEGRDELLVYEGDVVKQYTAPDGGVTDYLFEYDDTNKQFVSKISEPETAAGRRTEDFTHNRAAKLVRRIVNGRVDEEIRRDTLPPAPPKTSLNW